MYNKKEMLIGTCNVNNTPFLYRLYDFTNIKKFDNVSGQRFLENENKLTFDYIKKTEIDGEEKGIYLWH